MVVSLDGPSTNRPLLMGDGARAWTTGVGVALAVSLPPTLVAQILDELSDDDLSNPITVPLSLLVMLGPLVGGWSIGRRRPNRHLLVAAAAGGAALAIVAVLGVARRSGAGDDARAVLVPAMALGGALLASAGSALAALAARTRP